MDTHKFKCQFCGGKIRSDLDMCGDTIECPHCENSISIPMPGVKAGIVIADFKVLKRLGVGGMGEVWLAEDTTRGRKVALKILSPALTRNDLFVQRFHREVRMAAKMSHPNIVTAFDAGVDSNFHYLATNYIDGQNLEEVLRKEGRLTESEALSIIFSITEALMYAMNKHNIMHRDIKPGNIMIDTDGIALLMDLGVSKYMDSQEDSLTTVGQFVGTPYYMSPEQARTEAGIDFRSDIYSLGCSLYHMLAGTVPFRANSHVEILNKHIQEQAQPVQKFNPKISDACAALLEIMISKEKSDRQGSWAEVARDINLVLAGQFPLTPCSEVSLFAKHQQESRASRESSTTMFEKKCVSPLRRRSKTNFDHIIMYILMVIIFATLTIICIMLSR
jgi:serine/threonine-protein kinase